MNGTIYRVKFADVSQHFYVEATSIGIAEKIAREAATHQYRNAEWRPDFKDAEVESIKIFVKFVKFHKAVQS